MQFASIIIFALTVFTAGCSTINKTSPAQNYNSKIDYRHWEGYQDLYGIPGEQDNQTEKNLEMFEYDSSSLRMVQNMMLVYAKQIGCIDEGNIQIHFVVTKELNIDKPKVENKPINFLTSLPLILKLKSKIKSCITYHVSSITHHESRITHQSSRIK